MGTLRLSFAWTVVLALCAGMSTGVVAQGETSAQDAPERELWFDLMIPDDMLSDQLEHIRVGRLLWDAGADDLIDPAYAPWQGRAILVESGELTVNPATDALLWRADSEAAEVASALEAHRLGAGDAIYLPPAPVGSLEPTDTMRIANPTTDDAMAFTFQLGPSVPMFQLPEGLAEGSWQTRFGGTQTMDAIGSGDTAFRLSRITAAPGTSMTMPNGAILAFYYVEKGEAGYLVDDTPLPWSGGQGVVSGPDEAVVVTGTDPAVLIELAAIPQPADQ
jgi:hypothetical protein